MNVNPRFVKHKQLISSGKSTQNKKKLEAPFLGLAKYKYKFTISYWSDYFVLGMESHTAKKIIKLILV